MVAWGLANAVDCDPVVEVPMWVTGGEPLVPGSEVPVPRSPASFLIGTAQSRLEDPSVLPDAERVLAEFEAACEALKDAMDHVETKFYDEFVRSSQADNPAGFRSARFELTLFVVLGTLSRGNRALVDDCRQDRNALKWHRRFIQHTADLTGDLHPELGGLLRDLLRNTFGERVDRKGGLILLPANKQGYPTTGPSKETFT